MKKSNSKISYLTSLALLIALELLMAFTPSIGYIQLGVVSVTLLPIPVAVGAVVLGPTAGGILGGIFGLSSFYQCFGMDPFGALLLGISPWKTFLVCFVPRFLMGVCVALLFRGLSKIRSKKFPLISAIFACALIGVALAAVLFLNGAKVLTYLFAAAAGVVIGFLFHYLASLSPQSAPTVLSSCAAAVLNTVFFVSLLVFFFGGNGDVLSFTGTGNAMGLVKILVTVNALIEASVSLVLGSAVNKILLAVHARVSHSDGAKS